MFVLRVTHRPVEDEVLAQLSAKLEKDRQRKARLEAGASQQPLSTSLSGTSHSRQTSGSDAEQTSTAQSDQNQSQSEKAKPLFDTDKNLPSSTQEGISAGAVITKEEPAAKKGKSGSCDTVEPMETESCGQISERGRPMETDETVNRGNTSSANGTTGWQIIQF